MIRDGKTAFAILNQAELPLRSVAKGTVILQTGMPSKEMFVVRRGKVAIEVHGKAVEEIGPGGIFGEMGLIDHEQRSADAVAVEDSDLIPIDERLFVILVQDTPYFALDVMRTLVERIRAMNERL